MMLKDATKMYSYNTTAESEFPNLGEMTPWIGEVEIVGDELKDGLSITRSELYHLEEKMKNSGLGVQLLTEHFFSPGIYTRVLHIPKGCLLTGKIHKEPILNIMVAGEISVLIGDEVKRIKAPYICVSPAGSKKIGYAHEDTVWVGCHGTDEFDLVKIEKRFVAQDEQDWLQYFNKIDQLELPLCG